MHWCRKHPYDLLVCFISKMVTHVNHHHVQIMDNAKTELAATTVIASLGTRASTVKLVPICSLLMKIFDRVGQKLPITMALALSNDWKQCKPALSVSDLQSFQSCVKTRMVAANIFAMWSMKTLNAPALVAISWIRITNLVYLMVRLTYKATTVCTRKKVLFPKAVNCNKSIFLPFFQRLSNVAVLSLKTSGEFSGMSDRTSLMKTLQSSIRQITWNSSATTAAPRFLLNIR